MRLKSLKLSGFKSFVEKNKLIFPSNLVGIVGPNGCGKSNTIDAVRWVLGERSAKHLRGTQMSDVIFNGSRNRKPVGKASVEMLFENSAGLIVGKYGSYNELSIKRSITRDGISNYYLNNTKVRRQDVMDLFAGTGLGSKGYSIIEQGLISRFVEAKPDDIRNMFEEAAGVSQYKERRRETEIRIKRTKENLDRIADSKIELDKSINRLNKQAKDAGIYKDLKKKQKLLKAQILFLDWQRQNNIVADWNKLINKLQLEIEAQKAKSQTNAKEIEIWHQNQIKANDRLNKTQSNYYASQNKLQTLEYQQLTLGKQLQQISKDLQQNSLEQVKRDFNLDKNQLGQLKKWILKNEQLLQDEKLKLEEISNMAQIAERGCQTLSQQYQHENDKLSKIERNIEVEKLKISNLERLELQHQQRLQGLQKDIELIPQQLIQDDNLSARYQESLKTIQQYTVDQSEIKLTIQQVKDETSVLKKQLFQKQRTYQEQRGKLSSLETLQKNTLEQPSQIDWLQQNKMAENLRLNQILEIEPGWEQACELVLGDFVSAICVQDLQFPQKIKVSVATTILQNSKEKSKFVAKDNKLASKINSISALDEILKNVFVVNSYQQAIEKVKDLKNDETVVSKDGVWLGKNWLKIHPFTKNSTSGILKREQEIRLLKKYCQQSNQSLGQLQEQIAQQEQRLSKLENSFEKVSEQLNQAKAQSSQLQSKINEIKLKNQQAHQNKQQINKYIDELVGLIEQAKTSYNNSKTLLEQLNSKLSQQILINNKIQTQKENSQQQLSQIKQKLNLQSQTVQKLLMQVEAKKSQLQEKKSNVLRAEQQLVNETSRFEVLFARQKEINDKLPDIKDKINKLIQLQLKQESELKISQQELSQIEHEYQQKQKRGKQLSLLIENKQTELDQIQQQLQDSLVQVQTKAIEIAKLEFNKKTLAQSLNDEDQDNLIKRQQKINAQIQRLGEINFASLVEYQTELKRKTYLESQMADLNSSLETLELAIAKIDSKTKDKFKLTFDLINQGFQRIFPQLFGGGKAYLQLTSNNLLDTGISVMAQPLGKRISSIQVLSGGEKALTAVALVFAIFELNPSPFCMLDEVDAPLDDANITRFCSLVKKMSKKVQFVFVTHNKITMELSKQLIGVTMQESGVSRLVAVDIEKAVSMTGV